MAAATKASAMPVLPLVGSMSVVTPGLMPFSRSRSSIIARPMRSLTLESGLKNSSFASTVAPAPSVILLSLTSGVLPIVSRMLS